MTKKDVPPLGVRPRFIAEEDRLLELVDAVCRYRSAKYKIPLAWINEMVHLLQRVNEKRIKDGDDEEQFV